jgi:hypothetical protein
VAHKISEPEADNIAVFFYLSFIYVRCIHWTMVELRLLKTTMLMLNLVTIIWVAKAFLTVA